MGKSTVATKTKKSKSVDLNKLRPSGDVYDYCSKSETEDGVLKSKRYQKTYKRNIPEWLTTVPCGKNDPASFNVIKENEGDVTFISPTISERSTKKLTSKKTRQSLENEVNELQSNEHLTNPFYITGPLPAMPFDIVGDAIEYWKEFVIQESYSNEIDDSCWDDPLPASTIPSLNKATPEPILNMRTDVNRTVVTGISSPSPVSRVQDADPIVPSTQEINNFIDRYADNLEQEIVLQSENSPSPHNTLLPNVQTESLQSNESLCESDNIALNEKLKNILCDLLQDDTESNDNEFDSDGLTVDENYDIEVDVSSGMGYQMRPTLLLAGTKSVLNPITIIKESKPNKKRKLFSQKDIE